MKPSEKWIENALLAASKGELAYQSWFESAPTLDKVVAQASLDFYHRLLTPDCYEQIGCPFELTSMEIGSGGGRLLANATTVFKHAFGCDIIYSQDAMRDCTTAYIENLGINKDRFSLIDPQDIRDLPDKSINFFYSFIVFQHMNDVETVSNYINEIKRLSSSKNMSRIFCARSEFPGYSIRKPSLDSTFDVTFSCTSHWFSDLVISKGGKVLKTVDIPPKRVWEPQSISGQFMIDFRF